MEIVTRDFGNITAMKDDIIRFTIGMYGFENYKKFIILKDDPDDNIMYLQSVENKDLSFVLIDPYSIINGYSPVVSNEDLIDLCVENEDGLKFLLVAIITNDVYNSVVNLKSPIAINPHMKIAKQVILENIEYPLRYSIFN